MTKSLEVASRFPHGAGSRGSWARRRREAPMTTSKSKFLTTCAATVLLAVALSACGGGGGSDPVTDADDMPGDGMMPGDGAMQHDQFVGEWSADWPGGGRTELQITEVASDGQVTGTFRHQQRGREPIVLEYSPDGSNTLALSSNGPTILGLTPYGTISVPIEDGTLRTLRVHTRTSGLLCEFDLVANDTDRGGNATAHRRSRYRYTKHNHRHEPTR